MSMNDSEVGEFENSRLVSDYEQDVLDDEVGVSDEDSEYTESLFLLDGRSASLSREVRYTSEGLAKCRLCGYAAADLSNHIREKHKIERSVGDAVGIEIDPVSDYQRRHAGWPIYGERIGDAGSLVYRSRPRKSFSVLEQFGFFWNERSKRDKMVLGYEYPGPYTPPIDPNYVFPKEATQDILLGFNLRDRIKIVGHSGTGKTSLVEQICARLGYNYARINMDGSIERPELLGHYIMTETGGMIFNYGMLPRAMVLPGTIIVLDEWDTMGGVAFVLQRVLEEAGQLQMLERGEEIITLHDENVFVATSNTTGFGDEDGLYTAGTSTQNFSQIRRFTMNIELDYLPREKELELLQKTYPRLKKRVAEALIECVSLIRSGFVNDRRFLVPLTVADTLNWAQKTIRLGNPMRAARLSFINRLPPLERPKWEDVISRVFVV